MAVGLLPMLLALTAPVMAGTTDCATVDISHTTHTLADAQTLARAAKAKHGGTACVYVLLGQRRFGVTSGLVRPTVAPLTLTEEDSHTSWVGGEITAAVDVAPADWQTTTSPDGVMTLPLPAAAVSDGIGDLTGTDHLQLVVEVAGVWRPMTLARWPNIPFTFDEVPPVNWTKVGSVNATCGTSCKSFGWANDTDRPTRWMAAASQGRLFVQGFFKFLWRDSRAAINKIDTVGRTLCTDSPTISATGVFAQSPWFAYGNLHEELDVAGEFAVVRIPTGPSSPTVARMAVRWPPNIPCVCHGRTPRRRCSQRSFRIAACKVGWWCAALG
jgi:hypothetical protein